MPRRYRLGGLSARSSRRRKRRYQGPPLPDPPVTLSSDADASPDKANQPWCPAAPDECKCAAGQRRTEGS